MLCRHTSEVNISRSTFLSHGNWPLFYFLRGCTVYETTKVCMTTFDLLSQPYLRKVLDSGFIDLLVTHGNTSSDEGSTMHGKISGLSLCTFEIRGLLQGPHPVQTRLCSDFPPFSSSKPNRASRGPPGPPASQRTVIIVLALQHYTYSMKIKKMTINRGCTGIINPNPPIHRQPVPIAALKLDVNLQKLEMKNALISPQRVWAFSALITVGLSYRTWIVASCLV